MTLSNLVQTISLAAVALSLALTAFQSRSTALQTKELVKQTRLTNLEFILASRRGVADHGSDLLSTMFSHEAETLAWFLASRGIPTGSLDLNKRYLFMFIRMEKHADIYDSYRGGAVAEDTWISWSAVMKLDVATPEFGVVWRVVRPTFPVAFTSFVDNMLDATEA